MREIKINSPAGGLLRCLSHQDRGAVLRIAQRKTQFYLRGNKNTEVAVLTLPMYTLPDAAPLLWAHHLDFVREALQYPE